MNKSELIEFDAPVRDKSVNIIKVIGVGGGGCNAVGNMYNEGMKSVTFAVMNTDSKSLSVNPVPKKLMLGKSGLGAGADPEKGRHDAEENIEDIRKILDDGTKMVFVASAMGGGTGTGAGPLVAGIAKQMGLLTIGVVTLPFYFERRRKIIKALRGLEEMRKNVDALLIINNEQITNVYSDSHIIVDDALKLADQVMTNAVRSISELITLNGKIQTDFADVMTTMKSGGGAIMAIGRASGEHRVQNAILDALNSPLLFGSDISKATRILFNIYTHPEHQLYVDELEEIDAFMDELDNNIDVIWGLATDNTLNADAKVTILATGFDNSLPVQVAEEQDPNMDAIIEQLYGRKRKRVNIWNGPKPINLDIDEAEAETEQTGNGAPAADSELAANDEQMYNDEPAADDEPDIDGDGTEGGNNQADNIKDDKNDANVNEADSIKANKNDENANETDVNDEQSAESVTPQFSFLQRVRRRVMENLRHGAEVLLEEEE